VCAVVAPLALGLLQATPVTWRAAMALPAVAFAVLFLVYRRQALPEHPASGARLCPLPKVAWLLAALVAVGIGIEFCVVYFGAELLSATTSLSTKAAVTAMALFYAGLLAGRVAGGVLARTPGRGSHLLSASLAVTLAGLFVSGAGIANLYPLSLALTLAAAPGQTDAANARTQLLGGLAVVAAPLALGGLADHIGLSAAFGVEPLLVVICWLLLRAGTGSGLRARTSGAPGTGTAAR
jgi:predicted MFS family arabinose efflux permease